MLNKIRNRVKVESPLVHAITNPISINQCANTILAVGARPIMAEHPGEVEEITSTTKALMLNIGNITDVRMESIPIALECAIAHGIPVVLDVVGVACSSMRKEFVANLLKIATPTVIKGNYSEIKALYDMKYTSEGVDADSDISITDMTEICSLLSRRLSTIILASGKTDIITDGKRLIQISNGSEQLSKVTGTGCMLGALCAAYMAVEQSVDAVITACVMLGVCGQISETEKGNGSFMVNLLDSLSTLPDEYINRLARTEEKSLEEI